MRWQAFSDVAAPSAWKLTPLNGRFRLLPCAKLRQNVMVINAAQHPCFDSQNISSALNSVK
ncbi:hypothetical protein ABH944_001662 [Caballeronia udeis]